ncbi:MAG: ATP-dependent RecD-like DNA helicase, partial [Verrucomicrobia bacterium]
MDGEKTTVEGVLERIVFFNEENCYCIAVMRPTSKGFPPGPITVAGTLPSVQCGETLRVSGTWVSRGAYGMQLKVESFESRLPSSIYGIEKFLGSGLVEGIGGGFAKKIVERFGEDTLRIIDSESARLREIRGIGAERARRIKKSWEEQKNLRDIVIFLRTYGVGMSMCVRIIRRFGDEAGEVVRSSPYRLAREIDGIGFATADRIALNMGIPNESPERIDAGVMHIVRECELDGNTCVPRGELVARASALLDADAAKCAEGVERMLAG